MLAARTEIVTQQMPSVEDVRQREAYLRTLNEGILVLDAYIRRTAAWLVGAIALAILAYVTIAFYSLFFADSFTLYVICVASTTVILAPLTWWLAKGLAERLFFSGIRHYRRIMDQPTALTEETVDLEEASRALTLAAVHTFETSRVCLFVLDENSGNYRVSPALKDDPEDASRRAFLQSLLQTLKQPLMYENADWLDLHLPAMERLALARRPMLLREVMRSKEEKSMGLGRYLTSTPLLIEESILLAPVRAQGKMIGVLALGERSSGRSYARSDFEVAQLLLTRFSSILEIARLYARRSHHTALLNSLYNAGAMLGYAFKSVEEVAYIYAVAAADAVHGGAEIWLYDEKENRLRRAAAVGAGPRITHVDNLQSVQERDWSACFCDGEGREVLEVYPDGVPSCLPSTPHFPFAWLPLQKGEQRLGIFVLTYPRPHFFVATETRVLEMFASQCASSLENARMTLELRVAYERQKELDRLKDEFIITASHELRTPLTTVQGYIELLHEYNASLSPEMCADFIEKAQRGCDELALMVGNIVDASHVQIDAAKVKLKRVPLVVSVTHVLEILDVTIKSEERLVTLTIPPELCVMADATRLRQVLLNLLNNALRYSPVGSSVEICTEVNDQWVTVCIRDYGSGVPLEDQGRLFERFVRLERDMNSPVRGAGLGLYICKQLVEAMGGRIWMESSGRLGEGSVFAFTLSRAVDEVSEGRKVVSQWQV